MKKKKKQLIIFFTILIFSIFLIILTYNFFNKKITADTNDIIVNDNILDFNSLTLKQKIAQMIMVRGDGNDIRYTSLNVGGIFLDRQKSEEEYTSVIEKFQKNSKLKLFVSTDLEGAWSPFHNPNEYQKFPFFSEINDSNQAYEIGLRHGELLKKIGYNFNFAPISEFSDDAYGGRVFFGGKEEVKSKIESYITGLQKNVFGTCKHYPGKSMLKNLHYVSDSVIIEHEDLELFKTCIKNNISSIMVSHQIASGLVDSDGIPSSVSVRAIDSLNDIDFNGLIIADEINMQGLKKFYPDKSILYKDLINSGENLILDFDLSPKELNKLLIELEKMVKEGKISEEKINKSVKKILIMKGYKVE